MIHPRPVIDGAVYPEQMSDEHALLFFVRAAALSEEGGYGRSRAYLTHLGITRPVSKSDAAANASAYRLITFATEFANTLGQVEAMLRDAQTKGDLATVAQLAYSRAELIRGGWARLRISVGDEFAGKVERAVNERVKRRMKRVN